ncbi:bifunctional adenosylcobinamide kinase/adenosylcobinamide-phosphate guanylyltransferase [Paenibacillus sp. MBLB4367]|uniref:bifunctional adenosylcobinamide kinase/adenosylcobinamide-phosphate guanylyltransferase n=1 Tax=Paenibacillus sp. MBLB4367 TaxID=3384767 RepID=UPI0039083EC8
MLVLITGGARSGKSSFAERYAAHLGSTGTYIATCQLYDDEMRDRVNMHKQDREASGFPWTTLEEPYELPALLDELSAGVSGASPIVLVDCLTLWLSNWLLSEENESKAETTAAKMRELVDAAGRFDGILLMVTNEVGSGIVPEYKLGRVFRDLAGQLNRRLAEVSDQVFLVTAGIPLEIKSRAFTFG